MCHNYFVFVQSKTILLLMLITFINNSLDFLKGYKDFIHVIDDSEDHLYSFTSTLFVLNKTTKLNSIELFHVHSLD